MELMFFLIVSSKTNPNACGIRSKHKLQVKKSTHLNPGWSIVLGIKNFGGGSVITHQQQNSIRELMVWNYWAYRMICQYIVLILETSLHITIVVRWCQATRCWLMLLIDGDVGAGWKRTPVSARKNRSGEAQFTTCSPCSAAPPAWTIAHEW